MCSGKIYMFCSLSWKSRPAPTKKNRLIGTYFVYIGGGLQEMRGAAAASAAHRSSAHKNNPRCSTEHEIEADSTIGKTDVNEEDKIIDPEYNEEQDHLYLFPPRRYQKGDISLGVLMSG